MRLFILSLAVLGSVLVQGTSPAVADCGWISVAATEIDFHRYRPRDPSPKDAVGRLQVRCSGFGTGSTAYTVWIDSGAAADRGPRRMIGARDSLAYDLFLDPARTQVWGGDGGEGSPLRGQVDADRPEGNSHPVYGRVFARQNVPPGEYSDQVTLTVFF